jgi:DNA ligase-1
MKFAEVVNASADVAATSKRGQKTERLAELLRLAAEHEVVPVVGFLTGDVHQGKIGIGWASVAGVVAPAASEPSLDVSDVDAAITELAAIAGPGSQELRNQRLVELYSRATPDEADFLGRLFVGDIRQGANHGVMTDAVAKASAVKLAVVRRAQMLAGNLADVARLALVEGQEAVEAVGLRVLSPIQPMLASTAADVAEAMDAIGGPVSVEWKLDGIRIQVHRSGNEVRIFTRNLNNVTGRLGDVVDIVMGFDLDTVVLDGEVIGESGDEGPDVFQDTMSRFGTDEVVGSRALRPHFFDILHLDGRDLVDEPFTVRREALESSAGSYVVTGVITSEETEAQAVSVDALSRGHEGVMVKDATSIYDAGRRGKSWRKVKPVITLDLVVIGAEWGHGRRTGSLSNLHLGARDPDGGPAIMVGKTFKGLTDQLLAWQTEAFLEREISRSGITVFVEQNLVVEIAIDGVQASTRYPGGVALRFARVRGYRDDKAPDATDSITDIRALLK